MLRCGPNGLTHTIWLSGWAGAMLILGWTGYHANNWLGWPVVGCYLTGLAHRCYLTWMAILLLPDRVRRPGWIDCSAAAIWLVLPSIATWPSWLSRCFLTGLTRPLLPGRAGQFVGARRTPPPPLHPHLHIFSRHKSRHAFQVER